MSDNDERLWNLMVWKMPLTNKELWGDSGEPPPFLFFVFFLIMIAAAIFIFANLMWPVK